MSDRDPDNPIGCVFCTEYSNCITHPKTEKHPTEKEERERSILEAEIHEGSNAKGEFRNIHRREIDDHDLQSKYEEPVPRNPEDTPFCCAQPHLEENRRAKGNPPASIEGNINHFVDAVNADNIEYMINDVDSTQDLVDATFELIKVNPLIKRVDDGTWLFTPSQDPGSPDYYHGIFKTKTLGFRSSGPRSYLVFYCLNCRKSYKIGYTTKTINPNAGTETFEYDQEIDRIMGIPNHPEHYHPTHRG